MKSVLLFVVLGYVTCFIAIHPGNAQWGQTVMMSNPGKSVAPVVAGVPPPANIASLTNNILNADFTAGGKGVVIGGNAAIPVTVSPDTRGQYIVNCGATASTANVPSTWVFTYVSFDTNFPHLSCARTQIVTDTVGGGNQALQLTLNIGDDTGYQAWLEWPGATGVGGNSAWLPVERMSIITFRTDCPTQYQQPNGSCGANNVSNLGDGGTWSTACCNFTSWVDLNDTEMRWPGGVNVEWLGGMQEGQNFPNNNVDMPAPSLSGILVGWSTYHTVATLYTSDESSVIWQCQWFDPPTDYSTGFIGCAHINLVATGTYTHRDRMWLTGFALQPRVAQGGVPQQNSNTFITNMQVWECANVASSGCPGVLVENWHGASGCTITGNVCQ